MRRTLTGIVAAALVIVASGTAAPAGVVDDGDVAGAADDGTDAIPEPIEEFLDNDPEDPFGRPHPEAPPENQFMGDLVGVWSCKTFGIWEATWAFKYATGGFAIEHLYYMQEEDLVPPFEPLGRDYYNLAIAMYDPVIDAWRQFGTENFGETFGTPNTTIQTGHVDGDTLILEPDGQHKQHGNDKKNVIRNTFHDITEESFTWTQYASTDRGKTWEVGAEITCDRAPISR